MLRRREDQTLFYDRLPLPTVGVRIVSVLSDNLQHVGQVAYLRGLLKGKGWM